MAQPYDDRSFFRLAAEAAAYAPIEILQPLWTPQEATERFKRYDLANAREFWVFKAIVEVQKFSTALLRWGDYLVEVPGQMVDGKLPPFLQQGLEARLAEHRLWQRRGVEILVPLIGFAGTNDPAYFFHHLLLREAHDRGHEIREQRDFFGSTSNWLSQEERRLAASADALVTNGTVLRDQCWYLEKGGRLLSMKGLIMHALQRALPSEQRALGYCYGIGYSEPSESVHYSPLSIEKPTIDTLRFASLQTIFILASIVERAQELLGIRRGGPACDFMRRAVETGPPRVGVAGAAARGDFVVVPFHEERYLAEVIDVITSPYGNESYRVRFLSGQPNGLAEDTLLPHYIGGMLKRAEMVELVREQLAGKLTDQQLDETIDDSLRWAAMTTWSIAGDAIGSMYRKVR